MTNQVWAHVTDGVCDNIAVFAEGTPMEYFPGFVLIDGLDPMPGIGWHYDGTNWYAPPNPSLVADPHSITGDETSTLTYTWQGWPEDAPPTGADFIVNDGAPQTEPMDGDTATLVVSATDADADGNIQVQCAGLVTTVTVAA